MAEEQKSGLALDFSGLFSDPDGEERKQPEQAKSLLFKAEDERDAQLQSLGVYQTYQENIKLSGELQTEILKGVKAGEDFYTLFLKAVKAISLMTSNELFYSQIVADTRSIYGDGLYNPLPLKDELRDAQKRLQRLESAMNTERYPQTAKNELEGL